MHRLKSATLIAVILAIVAATACAPVQVATTSTSAAPPAVSAPLTVPATPPATVAVAVVAPGPADAGSSSAVTISLGDQIAVNGVGAAVSGNTVTITAGSIYRLTGTVADGQVIVAAPKTEPVELILDGAGITSSTSAPIYVKSAKSATVVLADGSVGRGGGPRR